MEGVSSHGWTCVLPLRHNNPTKEKACLALSALKMECWRNVAEITIAKAKPFRKREKIDDI